MSHLEHEGKIYCDWRITIENCEGSEFFLVVNCLGEAFTWISIICLLISLSIRKFTFGETLKIIPAGENGLSILITLVLLVYSLQLLSVLLNWPYLVSGVLWAFSYPSINITITYHVSFLRKAAPKFTSNAHKWHLSARAHTSLLLAFAVFLFITHVTIISVAQALSSNGQVPLGRLLEKAGLAVTSLNCLLLIVGLSHGCLLIKCRIQDCLKETKEVTQRGFDHTLLMLTSKKVQQHIVTIIILGGLQVIYFVLLAFYPGFFTNLRFSKALATIMIVFHSFNSLLHCFLTLVFDLKKWHFQKQVKENSSKSSSRKEEAPTIRMSLEEKDQAQVQQIIEELRPSQD